MRPLSTEIGIFTNNGITVEISAVPYLNFSAEIGPYSAPEPAQPSTDGNLWGWYRSDQTTKRVTDNLLDTFYNIYAYRLTGSSAMIDQSGNSRHFAGSSITSTPYLFESSSNGNPAVVFRNGGDITRVATADHGLAQPYTVQMLMESHIQFQRINITLQLRSTLQAVNLHTTNYACWQMRLQMKVSLFQLPKWLAVLHWEGITY